MNYRIQENIEEKKQKPPGNFFSRHAHKTIGKMLGIAVLLSLTSGRLLADSWEHSAPFQPAPPAFNPLVYKSITYDYTVAAIGKGLSASSMFGYSMEYGVEETITYEYTNGTYNTTVRGNYFSAAKTARNGNVYNPNPPFTESVWYPDYPYKTPDAINWQYVVPNDQYAIYPPDPYIDQIISANGVTGYYHKEVSEMFLSKYYAEYGGVHDILSTCNQYLRLHVEYTAALPSGLISSLETPSTIPIHTPSLMIGLNSPAYNDSNNSFQFNIHMSTAGDFPVKIQKSTDAYNWTDYTGFFTANGDYLYTDNNAGTGNAFYRVCTENQTEKSANAVGFISVGIPNGWSMRANPLGNSGSLSTLFYSMPTGTLMYKWDSSSQSFYSASSLYPGEGVLIYNPGPAVVRRIVGDLRQGSFSTYMPSLKSMVSSQVPTSGYVESGLGCPFVSGEIFYSINTDGTYFICTRRTNPQWPNGQPYVGVGDSFMIQKSSGQYWSQSYNLW